ncbi:MAG TPA: L-threonylcarbamoyladenylate synthase, partial [Candidatus Hydrogenedentes bacterium]|nr:L-threonylcarbamoyladenylate synthase [Candidatus Hydrogenedentota bacterium]
GKGVAGVAAMTQSVLAAQAEGALEKAVTVLRGNGVVAYPTETVYGLAVDPFSETALDRLYEVKGRPSAMPVLLVVADRGMVEMVVKEISEKARRCMEIFWPGPLSLLLPARSDLPKRVIGPEGKVCVRCSSHYIARGLSRLMGRPITSTSANLTGSPPARTAREAALQGVDLILDGTCGTAAVPSTVFDPDTGKIVREGPITEAMLYVVCHGNGLHY